MRHQAEVGEVAVKLERAGVKEKQRIYRQSLDEQGRQNRLLTREAATSAINPLRDPMAFGEGESAEILRRRDEEAKRLVEQNKREMQRAAGAKRAERRSEVLEVQEKTTKLKEAEDQDKEAERQRKLRNAAVLRDSYDKYEAKKSHEVMLAREGERQFVASQKVPAYESEVERKLYMERLKDFEKANEMREQIYKNTIQVAQQEQARQNEQHRLEVIKRREQEELERFSKEQSVRKTVLLLSHTQREIGRTRDQRCTANPDGI